MAAVFDKRLHSRGATVPWHHGKRRRPLTLRNNWGPWLPPTEAYPVVPAPLKIAGIGVLVLVAFVVLVILLAYL